MSHIDSAQFTHVADPSFPLLVQLHVRFQQGEVVWKDAPLREAGQS